MLMLWRFTHVDLHVIGQQLKLLASAVSERIFMAQAYLYPKSRCPQCLHTVCSMSAHSQVNSLHLTGCEMFVLSTAAECERPQLTRLTTSGVPFSKTLSTDESACEPLEESRVAPLTI